MPNLETVCPVSVALTLIKGKWKPSILWQLTQASRRFNELHVALPGIAHKVLSEQLAQLCDHGLVVQKEAADERRGLHYALTARGRSLRPALDALAAWGKRERSAAIALGVTARGS